MRSLVRLVVLALLPTLASGQSLGEAARKEKERRKKNEETGVKARSFTDADVRTVPASPSPAPGKAAARRSGRAPEEGAVSTSDDVRLEQEEAWRGRFSAARARVESAQAYVERLEREWFLPGSRSVGFLQGEKRKAQDALEAARKALADLEERARRENVPAGWQR